MSWIKMLDDTYENLIAADSSQTKGLLPIAHSTQKAHITVTIDSDANFESAEFVEDVIGKNRNLSETLIPVTEKSAARTSGPISHPLCDKLQYLAGDYSKYCNSDNSVIHEGYLQNLSAWHNSEHTNEKVDLIYKYISKGTLIQDLVNAQIFSLDSSGKLTDKWENCSVKLSAGNQSDAFIRFRVNTKDSAVSAVWQDKNLQNDFIKYYETMQDSPEFCYVKGDFSPSAGSHPSKIRNSADKAKLISSNDISGFTFIGRFETASQAVTISYDASQKAHSALKFLIRKQGEHIGDRVFVLWGTKSEKTPLLNQDTDDFCDDDDQDLSQFSDTKEYYAKKLNRAISGYKSVIKLDTQLVLMGLDAATTGRLAIVYYREYFGTMGYDLLDNIASWHKSCEWYHQFKFKDGVIAPFYGAPAPRDIALCAFGTEQNDFISGDDKQIAKIVARILPCITDGAKIPRDIVSALVTKCYFPQSYTHMRNWKKVLSITCSMYKKYLYDYNEGEIVTMETTEKSNDISYLCGKLLAIADEIETYAQMADSDDSNKRTTNAMRYFSKFSRTPCETWGLICEKLTPYKNKLGPKGNYLYTLEQEISSQINPDEFLKAKNLDGKMALGFDTQKKLIRDRNKSVHQQKELLKNNTQEGIQSL